MLLQTNRIPKARIRTEQHGKNFVAVDPSAQTVYLFVGVENPTSFQPTSESLKIRCPIAVKVSKVDLAPGLVRKQKS